MSAKNIYTTFTSVDRSTKLTVYRRVGKRGINVGASEKKAGAKAVPGCQSSYAESDAASQEIAEQESITPAMAADLLADSRYEFLTQDAAAKGWVRKVKAIRVPKIARPTFSEIPHAPRVDDEPAPTMSDAEAAAVLEANAPTPGGQREAAVAEADQPRSRRARRAAGIAALGA